MPHGDSRRRSELKRLGKSKLDNTKLNDTEAQDSQGKRAELSTRTVDGGETATTGRVLEAQGARATLAADHQKRSRSPEVQAQEAPRVSWLRLGQIAGWWHKAKSIPGTVRKISRAEAVAIAPGLALMAMGVIVVASPALLHVAVAVLVTLLGFFVSAFSLKALQFKKRLEKITREFEGQILVQRPPVQTEVIVSSRGDDKKFIVH